MNQEITRLEHKATDSKEAFGFINGWNSCVALLESQSTHSAADEIERLRGVLARIRDEGVSVYSTRYSLADIARAALAEGNGQEGGV